MMFIKNGTPKIVQTFAKDLRLKGDSRLAVIHWSAKMPPSIIKNASMFKARKVIRSFLELSSNNVLVIHKGIPIKRKASNGTQINQPRFGCIPSWVRKTQRPTIINSAIATFMHAEKLRIRLVKFSLKAIALFLRFVYL